MTLETARMPKWVKIIFFLVFWSLAFCQISLALRVASRHRSHCPSKCTCFKDVVRCTFSNLASIPKKLPPETRILDLRFNRISRISASELGHLNRIETILLNNNDIETIEDDAFNGLMDLKTLYLYKNRLHAITNRTFSGLPELQFLYLQQNQLETVGTSAFDSCRKLQRLFLNHNKLRRVPYKAFQELKQLERLRLDANSLVCDCQTLWITELANKNTENLANKNLANKNAAKQTSSSVIADCMYPDEMRGQDLMEMSAEKLHCSSPKIMAEPESLDVRFGDTIYLHCKADGDPTPEIVWMHNDTMVSPDHHYSVLEDGTLMIDKTRPEDLGFYECMAKSPVGEARTRRAEVRYHYETIPRILHSPRDTDAPIGGSVRLTCFADGEPRPLIEWTFQGRPLTPDHNVQLTSDGRALTILHVTRANFGSYECTAFNRNGQVSAAAQIFGAAAPEFIIRPTEISATEGAATKLLCEVNGHPRPVVTWLRRGIPVQTTRNIQISDDRTTLSFESLSRHDADEYSCQASNYIGNIRASAQVRIRATSPPRITVAPSSANSQQRETVVFNCAATGDPTPRLTWLFNGSPVPTVRGHYEITPDGSLYVHDVTQNDAGYYSCQAANDVGSALADARLVVTEDPSLYNVVDQQLIHESLEKARHSVDRAINTTRESLYDGRPKSPEELLTIFRYPGPQAVELARAREIYEETLHIIQQHVQRGLQFNLSEFHYDNFLSEAHLQLISQLSGCKKHRDENTCSDMCFHRKYRTYDGTCNNLQKPMQGASLTGFKRVLSPIYENGFNTPVGWNREKLYHGFSKPSARKVSTTVVATSRITPDREFTHFLMQWGQFIDHDLDFAVVAASRSRFESGLDCKRACVNEPPCFNIAIPADDPRIRDVRCMEFERNSAVCGSGETSIFMNTLMPREQINQITSYIDASSVYGSNEEDALELRDLFSDHGLLKFDIVSRDAQKPYLPFNRNSPMDCRRNASSLHRVRCHLAGDYRANEQLGLLATHTLWLREHNRIAAEFLNVNPHWDGEKIYQETRKIIGAIFQHITYDHWLPKIIGQKGMNLIGQYRSYDPTIDASVSNVFATAAFRFGHSLINPVLLRLNASFQPIAEGHIPLHMAFFAPERLLNEGGIDPLLRGLFATPAKVLRSDQFLNTELTEKLFALAENIALDLAAINIQRGRDHGLPGYLEWRRFCGLSTPETFEGFSREIPDPRLRQKLERIYGHPGNVDLWVGGLSELPEPDARIGPTFTCILADQFRRTRDGDRFWHENPGVFDSIQLAEIKHMTLAKVLCHNGDKIDRVQSDVFLYPGTTNPSAYKLCAEIPDLNLNAWQECCNDECQGSSGSSDSEESDSASASATNSDEVGDEVNNNFRRRRRRWSHFSTHANKTQRQFEKQRQFETEKDTVTHNGVVVLDQQKINSADGEQERTSSSVMNKWSFDSEAANGMRDEIDFGSETATAIGERVDFGTNSANHEGDSSSHNYKAANPKRRTTLEGVEGLIWGLQQQLETLEKRTKALEAQLHESTKDERNNQNCLDEMGTKRNNGEEWTLDVCTLCSCKNGQIWCSITTCPRLHCDNPRNLPFLCCQIC